MKLKFFNPETADKNIRATAHKTGKIGFTIEASKKMELSTSKSVGIAINDEDETDTSLYLVVYSEKKDSSFGISKNGDYYAINAKQMFDTMGIDYVNDYVSYDISTKEIDGQTVFVLTRREKPKSHKKETTS